MAAYRRRKTFVHSVTAKLDDDQMVVADTLRSVMDPPTHTEAIRWLYSSDAGKELIARKVRGEIE